MGVAPDVPRVLTDKILDKEASYVIRVGKVCSWEVIIVGFLRSKWAANFGGGIRYLENYRKIEARRL